MKIGLISDTHSYLDDKVFSYFDKCDEVWHAGDIGSIDVADKLSDFKPFKAVYGNIDGHDIRNQYPEHLQFECAGSKVWITHIGGYPPKYTPAMKKLLAEHTPDLFICGHSHILKVMSDPKMNNLLHMNPGAAGKHGFHKIRTLLRFEINEGKIGQVQAIELGKRA
ncbi:MAG: metallophosphoesterase family protein [Bacteroidota bacterium]